MNKQKKYDEKILKHFINPHNVGIIVQADAYARVQNPVNGYTTDLYLSIQDDKIIDARFKTYGCTVTIAAGSAITTILIGKRIHEILSSENPIQFFEQELTKELGEIPEKNWHCIPSVIKVVFLALYVYFEKQNNTEYTNKLQRLLDNITRSCNNKLHES